MDKTGRNDPCPCGSGKKYKKCCLPKQEAEERRLAAEQQAERAAAHSASLREAHARMLAGDEDDFDDDIDELTAASNATIDLVRAGHLDEAERAAHDLIERFPDVHDGWDRLGMVYEARGDNKKAADCYRKVIDFIRAHPDNYDDDGFDQVFVRLVEKLDPPAR